MQTYLRISPASWRTKVLLNPFTAGVLSSRSGMDLYLNKNRKLPNFWKNAADTMRNC